jgi:hypothetical protein
VGQLFHGLATRSFPVIPTIEIESGKAGMVVARAMDQEAFAFLLFDHGRAVHDHTGKGRMGGISSPGAYQAIELSQGPVRCHRIRSFLQNGA